MEIKEKLDLKRLYKKPSHDNGLLVFMAEVKDLTVLLTFLQGHREVGLFFGHHYFPELLLPEIGALLYPYPLPWRWVRWASAGSAELGSEWGSE